MFEDRQSRLPDSNGRRTGLVNLNGLFWEEDEIDRVFLLWEDFGFGQVNGTKGVRLIMGPAEAETVRSRQKRWQEPKPPPIQVMLQQAFRLKARLDATPGLTRDALAREVGINPSYLSRLLNLLNLAPEIKRFILALPLSQTKGPITESRIKQVARIENHTNQIREFNRIKESPIRRGMWNHSL